MIFCEAPPLILFLYGDLAITTRSLPSLLAVPIFLAVCLFLCIRRRTLGWVDPVLIAAVTGIQLAILRTGGVADGAAGLAGYLLLAPYVAFLFGYGAWRLAGKRPLTTWPWPRFGLTTTTSLVLADIGVALMTPAAPGKVWQLGGACLRDALLLGPPFLMVVYYGLLDCRSSWVFCSQKCVSIGRCRFGMDGKAEACGGESGGGCQCQGGNDSEATPRLS